MKKSESVTIGNTKVLPGKRATIDVPVAKLYTHTDIPITVEVINGKKAGPQLFVCAAIHGDELNGVEIIRRLLIHPLMRRLRGALVAVPIVNVHGFLNRSRYLPDRRDLNRCFPGTLKGSLGSRIANIFLNDIIKGCTHGIDLHTGALMRNNLPHIRANMKDEDTLRLAKAFGTPLLVNSDLRDGSLRQALVDMNITTLLYEAGEALRFDEMSIRVGLRGILNVMHELGMFPPSVKHSMRSIKPVIANSTFWVRAPESGILRSMAPLRSKVEKGQVLGIIADPYGEKEVEVISPCDGIILGKTNLPLMHEGEGLYHIACFDKVERVSEKLEKFQETFQPQLEDVIQEEEHVSQ